MKKLLIIASLGIASAAFAQDENPIKLDVRAGVAWPATADINGTFFGVGLDVTFGKSLFNSGETYVSGDWITKSTKGNRNNLYTFMLNQRFNLNSNDIMKSPEATRVYGFVGVGAAILDIQQSATVLAGRIGLGADFNEHFFGEATLVITGRGKGNQITGNHIGVYVGYRL